MKRECSHPHMTDPVQQQTRVVVHADRCNNDRGSPQGGARKKPERP